MGLVFGALTSTASNPVNYDSSKWTIHSAFDNKPRKIIDTPNTVYFLVHQGFYTPIANGYDSTGSLYYNSPTGAIFFYDKKNPGAGLQDLAKTVNLSGFDIRIINYNPANGMLVIGYQDGGIDVVSSTGSVTYLNDLKKRISPGADKISAINFDPVNGDMWIGTGAGFIRYDKNFRKINSPEWSEAVTDIIPVGDRIVAVIANKLYAAPASSNLSNRNVFVAQSTSVNPGTITNLMPLKESFASLNTGGIIHLYSSNGTNSWAVTENGGSNKVITDPNNYLGSYVIGITDHTVTPTANGFYVAATDKAYFVNRPESENAAPTVTSVTFPSARNVYSSSFDGQTYWFYDSAQTFSSQSSANNWSGEVSKYTANAPLGTKDQLFFYNPQHGMVMVNRHPHLMTQYYGGSVDPLVATYKDGKWRNLAPKYHVPKLAATSAAALNTFNLFVGMNCYPFAMPCGAALDPLNPDVLYLGSPNYPGIVAYYLDDPTKTPHFIREKQDNSFDSFNALRIIENSGWNIGNPTLPLGSDGDGVMWFRGNQSNVGGNYGNLMLYAITPEGRKDALEIADPFTKRMDVKLVTIPADLSNTFWIYGLALKHPDNNHTILSGQYDGDDGIRVFRHNGDLDDKSGYQVSNILNFKLPTGDLRAPTQVRFFAENPVNGDIVVTTFFDTYVFNLKNPIINNVIEARTLEFTSENGQTTSFRPSSRSNTMVFDEYGRLWAATTDNGVIGISEDGKSVVAHFTVDNSPIGSNDVHGIGWNPDTKSLFISTNETVTEVKVDSPVSSESVSGVEEDYPFALPTRIDPSFSGTVAIHNAPASTVLRVRDSQGKTVCELDNTVNGVAYWDTLDQDGNLVPSGRYTIVDATGELNFPAITINIVR